MTTSVNVRLFFFCSIVVVRHKLFWTKVYNTSWLVRKIKYKSRFIEEILQNSEQVLYCSEIKNLLYIIVLLANQLRSYEFTIAFFIFETDFTHVVIILHRYLGKFKKIQFNWKDKIMTNHLIPAVPVCRQVQPIC